MPDKAKTPSETLTQLRQNLAQHFNREELRTLCFDLGIKHENFPDAIDGLARELVAHCERNQRTSELVRRCRELRPDVSWAGLPARLFICYKRNVDPDQKLATYLRDFLTAQGHDVFIDATLRTGAAWLEEIDQQIKSSDFLIVLLSESSADSEMVQAEVSRAYEYRQSQGRPAPCPAHSDRLRRAIALCPARFLESRSIRRMERRIG